MSRSTTKDLAGLLALFPEFASGKSVWICDEKGNLLEHLDQEKKVPAGLFEQLVKENPATRFFLDSEKDKIDLTAELGIHGKTVFSCQKLNFKEQRLLVFRMKEEINESDWKPGFMAEEFGIYPWRYEPDQGILNLGQGLTTILGIFGNKLELDDFLSLMSPESLTRFTSEIENSLNFGTSFKTDILLETESVFRWLSVSGRLEKAEESQVITGFIRDISTEKAEKERLHQLENWIRAGMSRLVVTDPEGKMLADLGSASAGQIMDEGPGRRKVKLVDFRNQIKYIVEAQTGSTHPEILQKKASAHDRPSDIDEGEELTMSREEKFTSQTRTLGIKTNSQVSALGIFDGSRFEWKAWWKSPSGYALPSKKYAGEWLPDLNWLLEMETENRQYRDRLWWPQDMLPFPIPDVFGKGWMLITEQLSSSETCLVALRNKTPESLMDQKDDVLKILHRLQDVQQSQSISTTEIEYLKGEIQRKEVLLKELNHRAKNNLALAAGMVKMQAGFSEDKKTAQFLKQTQKRLETLASLHELMYMGPSRDGKIEIQAYLNELLNGLHSGFGHSEINLNLHLDEAEIHVRFAITIGLLVNEIASNAYKHAFPEGKSGNLRVDFLSKGDFFKLRISDDGPGFDSDSKDGNSLGNILIDEFIKQLGASMEISRNPGTTYLISIKKSNIGL